VNKTVLGNGIRIVTKNIPHFRSISMGVWVNAGARDESSEESGLSHLMEHMIFKGTRKRSAFQIAKEFDAIGGHTNAFTSLENTCYHAKVMDTHLEAMVDILTDIFLNSLFDPEELDRERPVILQEIGMVEDSPEDHVHLLSGSNLWGNHPLGRSILGPRDNICGFSAEDLRVFFQKFYQPNRIVIAAAGNLDHERIVDLLGDAFESVQSGSEFPERVFPEGQLKVSVHSKELEQVLLCLNTTGISITDPRRYTYSLFNSILGGNMSSRLFQTIREQHGLAYSIYSSVSSYVDTGAFGIHAGVDSQNVKKAIKLILEAIVDIKRKPVSSHELADAKEYTKGSLLLSSESNDNQMVRLAQNEIYFGKYTPMAEIMEKIDAVSVDDIHDLAKDLFGSKSLALTMLGPVSEEDNWDDLLAI
jgi:predicted Zn-dependent peptidase